MFLSRRNQPAIETDIEGTTPNRRSGVRRAALVAGVLAGNALLATTVLVLDIGNVASDNQLWPYETPTCPQDWQGPRANPVKLAEGFHRVYQPVIDEAVGMSYEDVSELTGPSKEVERAAAVYDAYFELRDAGVLYDSERFATQSDVACRDGSEYRVGPEAAEALDTLRQAGYGIDPMTGDSSSPG